MSGQRLSFKTVSIQFRQPDDNATKALAPRFQIKDQTAKGFEPGNELQYQALGFSIGTDYGINRINMISDIVYSPFPPHRQRLLHLHSEVPDHEVGSASIFVDEESGAALSRFT